ncbi:hypothetical protein ACW2B4_18570, partial [Acinetobacter pittii]
VTGRAKGTGLGLSMAQKRRQQQNGRMEGQAGPGKTRGSG